MEGKLEKLPDEDAEAYWYRRPLKSRIGSKLSQQSKVIPNRQVRSYSLDITSLSTNV